MRDEIYKTPTRDELKRMFREDPEYNNPTTEDGKRRKRVREENERAGAPLVQEMRAAGLHIEELNDIMRIRFNSKAAIPILLWWLPRTENLAVKEIIARALTDKWARPEAQLPLIGEFLRAADGALKWAIGNALETIQDDRIVDDVLEIVQDKRHGRARQMMVMGLWKFKDPCAVDAAIKLLEDDDVVPHALSAVGRFKPKKAIPYVERLLSHPKTLVRKKAKQVLEKIEKSGK